MWTSILLQSSRDLNWPNLNCLFCAKCEPPYCYGGLVTWNGHQTWIVLLRQMWTPWILLNNLRFSAHKENKHFNVLLNCANFLSASSRQRLLDHAMSNMPTRDSLRTHSAPSNTSNCMKKSVRIPFCFLIDNFSKWHGYQYQMTMRNLMTKPSLGIS